MSFPRYPAYRESGVGRFGLIPAHWQLTPLKRRYQVVSGSTPKSDAPHLWDGSILWVTPGDLSRLFGFDISSSMRTITQEGLASCGTTLVPAGSVILSTRAPIGSLGIAATELCTNQGCKALVPRADQHSKFLAYLLSVNADELNVRGRGTTFLELSADELGSFMVPFPPSTEQWAISEFLDRETAKIDALVAEQERLIALLKEKRQAVISHAVTKGLDPSAPMKDSGVEWLGQVPAHWSVVALNHRYEIALGKMLDEKRVSGNHLAPYLRNVDVQWDRINVEELPQMDFNGSDLDRYGLRVDDLLVCEGGDVGRSAIWRGELTECYYQKALHRLRPRDVEADLPRFQFYLMQAAAKLDVFSGGQGKATIVHLTAEALRRYKFAYPGRAEQVQVVEHLDEAVGRLDKLIDEAANASQLLQERRSALISAAVTGQIDVRGLVTGQAAA